MFCHNLAIIIDRCFNRLSEGMKMGLCMRWQAVVLLHFGKSIHLDVNMCQSEAYLPEGMSLVPAVPLWCWLYLRLGPGFPSPPSEVQDLLVPRQPLHTHPQTVSSHAATLTRAPCWGRKEQELRAGKVAQALFLSPARRQPCSWELAAPQQSEAQHASPVRLLKRQMVTSFLPSSSCCKLWMALVLQHAEQAIVKMQAKGKPLVPV